MINGEVIIDGWKQHNLSLGDEISLKTSGPENSLTSLQLTV